MGGSVVTLRDAAVRGALLSTSTRLEALWREALEQTRLAPPASIERLRWDQAVGRIVEAMIATERYAGTIDPSLGRRDWARRTPTPR